MKLSRTFFAIAMAVTATALTIWAPSLGAQTAPTHVKGQILVKFKDGVAASQASATARQHSAKLGQQIPGIKTFVVSVPVGKETTVINALSKNPNVEYAELDVIAQSTADYFDRQYALNNTGQSFTNTLGDILIPNGTADADVDAPEAWAVAAGTDVKVAVLDTGVDFTHPDISSKVTARANFTSAGADDIYGHGTHVSGIIAAIHENNEGVKGVCPGCQILSGKVLDDNGYGSASMVANGISWAVTNNAKVINMSLGFKTSSRTLENAVNNAWNNGVVIVAAAGNGANTTKEYPGAYTNVIGVAATDNNDQKASFSTYSASFVDVAAPGANVYSTFPDHAFTLGTTKGRSMNYDVANGTSMASPIVAGVAALVYGQYPTASNAWVRSCVEKSSDKIAGTGTYWSQGRVNAYNAVTACGTPTDVVSTPTSPTGKPGNGKGSGKIR